jgi:cytochrome c oxidase subunit 2
MQKRLLLQMLVIAVIASAIGIAVALSINWFPVAAATRAKPVDDLYDVLLIVSVPIFVLVEVVVLFSVWKFRMRPGEEEKDGPPIHGNTMLEIIWTAVPALLIFGLVAYAYTVLHDIEAKKPNTLTVNVTGQQFAWSFRYGLPGGRSLNSDVLYLPDGRPILFRVHSTDVIHSFFVPAFRSKIDAVPGITTTIRVTPSRIGDYQVVCAELCGLGHSTMRAPVRVVAPAQFTNWLARQSRAPGATATG